MSSELKCDICDKVFNMLSKRESHVCVWYCIECCKSFHYKHVYKRHMDSIHGEHKRVIKNTSNECEYCNKSFSTISNKNKHEKKCKENPNISVQHPTVNNITNNITNTNNNINNITNNITNNTTNNIVIFGNEDFSYISKKDIQEALRTKNVLPRLCKLMRRNPNHPENRNIKVTDFSRGKTRIFGQYGWEPAQPIDTFNNMINEASGILDNKTYDDKIEYSQPDLEKVDEITDKVHELDMAHWQGRDTRWGQENRRAIMLEFVE